MTKIIQKASEIIVLYLQCTIEDGIVTRTTKYYDFPDPFSGMRCLLLNLKYHNSWDWQIPVWSKVCLDIHRLKKGMITYSFQEIRIQEYNEAIKTNNKIAAFGILVETIRCYNELKNNSN